MRGAWWYLNQGASADLRLLVADDHSSGACDDDVHLSAVGMDVHVLLTSGLGGHQRDRHGRILTGTAKQQVGHLTGATFIAGNLTNATKNH
jgi:hypothetical protein